MRIIHRGQHRRLAAEHLREPLISQQIPAQVLDRHQRAGLLMPGQHHITETARAERLQPDVPRNAPPGHGCLPAAVPSPGLLVGDQRVIAHQ
jgi:hypothetical protein